MDLKISKQDKGKLNATSSVLTKNLPGEREAGEHRYMLWGESLYHRGFCSGPCEHSVRKSILPRRSIPIERK